MSADVQVPEKFQYLRDDQRESIRSESDNLHRAISDPNNPNKIDRAEAFKRKRSLDTMLVEQEAPDLTPEQRDSWSKESDRLAGEIQKGMLSAEVMRRNPPGAVNANVQWQRRNSSNLPRWKNIQRALHKGSDLPDVANVERLRDHSSAGDPSFHDAQVPRNRTMVGVQVSPEYKEGYDRIFGKEEDLGAAEVAPEKKAKIKTVSMLCGIQKSPRGKKKHEEHCADCQAIQAGASETPSE